MKRKGDKELSNNLGSYMEDDVIFLLKDISEKVVEKSNIERERAIQSGTHYSEMLPIEYSPSEKYLEIFHSSLKQFSTKLAIAVALTAEKILKIKGENTVIVSLARAGTPAGVLIKRYVKYKYSLNLNHYSISIIRGKGIDENAVKYILKKHPNSCIQFVDGWTGKGAITKELTEAVCEFKTKYGEYANLHSDLAVLADPGHTVKIYGTREDFLIPNACLNSTISGLLSRTVHRMDIINKNDFHGVKYYKELEKEDLSNYYIDIIEKEFSNFDIERNVIEKFDFDKEVVDWEGMKDIKNIERDFDIESIHFIKPGIGETTRVLLRRIPWKILVAKNAKNIDHVLQLAKEKGIPVEEYPLNAYYCCGIVKSLKGE
ncbi:cysteine protease StiP family protein [Helicovermis profundi]